MTKSDDLNCGSESTEGALRSPYQPPALVCLGDIRIVTLGQSTGVDESGLPNTFRR